MSQYLPSAKYFFYERYFEFFQRCFVVLVQLSSPHVQLLSGPPPHSSCRPMILFPAGPTPPSRCLHPSQTRWVPAGLPSRCCRSAVRTPACWDLQILFSFVGRVCLWNTCTAVHAPPWACCLPYMLSVTHMNGHVVTGTLGQSLFIAVQLQWGGLVTSSGKKIYFNCTSWGVDLQQVI